MAAAPCIKTSVPAEFRNDRIFVTSKAPDGSALTFFTDSGGGFNAIRASVADRLSLPKEVRNDAEAGEMTLVDFPAFLERNGIPRPTPQERHFKGRLVVSDDERLDEDGFLGTRWFADRVWEIDYLERSFKVLRECSPFNALDHRAELGFRSDSDGIRDLSFPRVAITVDGEQFEMLLDTGATAQLTDTSSEAYGLPAGTKVGASYITMSTFSRWETRHPDWKVIERAEAGTNHAFSMIQVPRITIAGQTVGPVWFTQRPDSAFRDYMSQMMDKPIEGAIGGSALKYFRVIIDYPGSAAYFWPAPSLVSPQ